MRTSAEVLIHLVWIHTQPRSILTQQWDQVWTSGPSPGQPIKSVKLRTGLGEPGSWISPLKWTREGNGSFQGPNEVSMRGHVTDYLLSSFT